MFFKKYFLPPPCQTLRFLKEEPAKKSFYGILRMNMLLLTYSCVQMYPNIPGKNADRICRLEAFMRALPDGYFLKGHNVFKRSQNGNTIDL
jgi:hypothetical protein